MVNVQPTEQPRLSVRVRFILVGIAIVVGLLLLLHGFVAPSATVPYIPAAALSNNLFRSSTETDSGESDGVDCGFINDTLAGRKHAGTADAWNELDVYERVKYINECK